MSISAWFADHQPSQSVGTRDKVIWRWTTFANEQACLDPYQDIASKPAEAEIVQKSASSQIAVLPIGYLECPKVQSRCSMYNHWCGATARLEHIGVIT